MQSSRKPLMLWRIQRSRYDGKTPAGLSAPIPAGVMAERRPLLSQSSVGKCSAAPPDTAKMAMLRFLPKVSLLRSWKRVRAGSSVTASGAGRAALHALRSAASSPSEREGVPPRGSGSSHLRHGVVPGLDKEKARRSRRTGGFRKAKSATGIRVFRQPV